MTALGRKGLAVICLLVAYLMSSTASANYLAREDVQAFVTKASVKTGLSEAAVREILAKGRYQQSIIDAISRPAEAQPWYKYRKIFLTDTRIRNGVRFWDENEEKLTHIANDYGLPPEIIVAILGVETAYGANMGSYRVLDALMTLGFDYPRRGAFFQQQLIALLELAEKEGLDIESVTGSYAGAMGMPQFIPTSYLAYAVDGNGDGRRDLWNNKEDVFASVANYLARHGWEHEGEVAFQVEVGDAHVDDLLNTGRDLKPKTTLDELAQRGVQLPEHSSVPGDIPVMLFTLTWPDRVEYWVGLNNFYVITRYNHSVLYAMAVYELAQAIRKARGS